MLILFLMYVTPAMSVWYVISFLSFMFSMSVLPVMSFTFVMSVVPVVS